MGHQEALPAALALRSPGRGFGAGSAAGPPPTPLPPLSREQDPREHLPRVSPPQEHQGRCVRGLRGAMDGGTVEMNRGPAGRAR